MEIMIDEHAESSRTCAACSKTMTKGYCIADGAEYYCSDECLHTEISKEEYDELFDMDCAYWTEWE
jgi:hypothetical protein